MLGLASRAASFDSVRSRWDWKPLHGCPGRYVLRGTRRDLTPDEVVGQRVEPRVYHPESTPDAVLVVPLEGGGLLSFRKPDGVTFVHTLNTPEGLERRLARFDLG